MSSQPSQAGKFKPTKPIKTKILPGASLAASENGNNEARVSDAHQNHSRRRVESDGPRTGFSKQSSRFVTPKGQVFFTGGTTKADIDKKQVSTRNRSVQSIVRTKTSGSISQNKAPLISENEEIIIGTVGEGVGDIDRSSTRDPIRRNRKDPLPDHEMGEFFQSKDKTAEDDIFLHKYDSSGDDSDEEGYDGEHMRNRTELSVDKEFPISVKPPQTVSNVSPSSIFPRPQTHIDAPLIDESNLGSWVIFKFPTRLPTIDPHSVYPSGSRTTGQNHSTISGPDRSVPEYPEIVVSNGVVTEHAQGDSEVTVIDELGYSDSLASRSAVFDDSLKHAKSGYYGKIIVHKSGKTYFIRGGHDDREPYVQMSMHKGINFRFFQQAVAIDVENSKYIPLGEVSSSFTVCPDIV